MTRLPNPLQWPEGFARTPAAERTRSRFVGGLVTARTELLRELDRLGAANVVITSDLPVRQDGLPYADGRATDPAVAVWFVLADHRGNHQERVFACDRWLSHAENMTAIARSVEALRGLGRWGMADVVQRAMGGFAALPPGREEVAPPAPPWRDVLDIGHAISALPAADLLAIAKARHRRLMAQAHPDAGGDPRDAVRLNLALDAAIEELEPKEGT